MELNGLQINVMNKKESHLVQDIFLYFGAKWMWLGDNEKEDDITFNGMFTYPRCLFINDSGYIDVKSPVSKYEETIDLNNLLYVYNNAKWKSEVDKLLISIDSNLLETEDYKINVNKDSVEINWFNNKYTSSNKTIYKYNMETLMFLKGLLKK